MVSRRVRFFDFLFSRQRGRFISPLLQVSAKAVVQQQKPKEVFMKKKSTLTQAVQFKDELVIIEPMKVRLSKKGNTVMVFLNHKTVMMFSKKFLDAVIARKYQKRGA